jgi:hypothetical protein
MMLTVRTNAFLVALAGACACCLPTQALGATIALAGVSGATDSHGIRYTVVTLTCSELANTRPNVSVGWTIRFPGQSTAEQGKELVANSSRDVAAITFQPATKVNTTFVATARGAGPLLLVTDFNKRVADLCAKHHKTVNAQDISVVSIHGAELEVVSVDYGRAEYTIRVRLLATGALRLIAYAKRPLT